jgi:pyroglutamyl-peptidase
MKILITGFGAFPGAPFNPTTALAARLASAARRRGVRCIAHVFETRYAAIDRKLPALIAAHRPDAILMFGLAADRKQVCIETLAHNRLAASSPDAGGAIPRRAVIARGAAPRRRGRAPFDPLVAAARASGIAAMLSTDAGDYLCNYLYWHALGAAAKPRGPRLALFVHVPLPAPVRDARCHGRAKQPNFTFDQLVRAGRAIVSALNRR